MTPEQIALLQKSWGIFSSRGNNVGISFYERMFEAYPHIRPLFKGDLDELAAKLMNMLNIVINGMHDLDALEPALLDLGWKHKQFGVKDEDYDIVGQCLLDTLSTGLGDEFTEEVRVAWVDAYGAVASVMLEGANAVEA